MDYKVKTTAWSEPTDEPNWYEIEIGKEKAMFQGGLWDEAERWIKKTWDAQKKPTTAWVYYTNGTCNAGNYRRQLVFSYEPTRNKHEVEKPNLVEKAEKNYLPYRSTEDGIEMSLGWHHTLTYGNKLIIAVYRCKWHGKVKDEWWIAAVYDTYGEDEVVIRAISDETFEDDGHAIAWAITEGVL